MGRNHDPSKPERPFRLPLRHHPERARIRRMDLLDKKTALSCGVHRLQAYSIATLSVSEWRGGHIYGRG